MSFTPPRRIELEYRKYINQLVSKYLNFPEGSTPEYVLQAFANLSRNQGILTDIAVHISGRMITMLKVSNARSWREAARQSSRGREIYEALQHELTHGQVGPRLRELVMENAKLISSIPEKVREHVNIEIESMQQQGERPELISEYLKRRIPQLTRHQASLIARTETSKAATALTQARSEDLNIDWYQWHTSEDARVRPSHRIMDKVLIAWSDPPNPEDLDKVKNHHGPYNAGGIYNCRCDAYPIISLDQVSWPAKVYAMGKIQSMTRGQFSEFSGIGRRIAA